MENGVLRTILLPTDGLASGAAAHQSTLALAQRFNARVSALGLVDTPWITRPAPLPISSTAHKAPLEDEQIRHARGALDEAFGALQAAAADAKVQLATAILEADPLQAIATEAAQHDLVVISRSASFRPEPSRWSRPSPARAPGRSSRYPTSQRAPAVS
jgi:hypothetical protein